MTAATLREKQWTDNAGTHIEIRASGPRGLVFSKKLTRTATGWVGLEEARAELIRHASAPGPARRRINPER